MKRQKKTLKKTRKFIVDGVEVSVTTSKIVTDNDTKNEEMRFLRYALVFICVPSVQIMSNLKKRLSFLLPALDGRSSGSCVCCRRRSRGLNSNSATSCNNKKSRSTGALSRKLQ